MREHNFCKVTKGGHIINMDRVVDIYQLKTQMGNRRAVVINIVPSSVDRDTKTYHSYEEAELTEQFKDFLAEL